MEILEILNILMAIVAISSPIIYYKVSKRLVKQQKDEIKEELKTYLMSLEGQQSIASLGQIFAVGLKKGIGLEGGILKGKTFGIPNQLLMTFLDRMMPEKGKKAISEEDHSTGSGKFG